MTKNNFLKQLTLLAVCLFLGFSASAQLKVGDNPTTINANSVLEVESTNKGFLLPRLALTSSTSFAPLTAHVAGMAVYNTATAGDVTPGYYYNNGTQWLRLAGMTGTQTADTSSDGWIDTASNTVLRTGNAGIGTSNPTWPLHVEGSSFGGIRLGTTGNVNHLDIWSGLNEMRIQGRGSAPRPMTFYTNDIERMRIDSGSNGNVGIGTAAPKDKLDVSNGQIVISGTGSRLRRDVDNSVLALLGGTAKATGSYINLFGETHATNAGLVEFQSKLSGNFVFWNAPTLGTETGRVELMRVTSTGRVGIGTTTPERSLHVVGNGIISQRSNSDPQLVLRRTDNVVGYPTQDWGFRVGPSGTFVIRDISRNVETFYIDTTAHVGIGGGIPTNRLHVSAPANPLRLEGLQAGTATDEILSTDATGVVRKLSGANLAGALASVVDTSKDGWIDTASNTVLRSGNVGIGTTNPAGMLEVEYNTTLASSILLGIGVGAPKLNFGWQDNTTYNNIRSSGAANDGVLLQLKNNTSSWNLGPNVFTVSVNNAERMRITNTGNVGIGTSTPAGVLHTNGTSGIYIQRADNTVDVYNTHLAFLRGAGTPALGHPQIGTIGDGANGSKGLSFTGNNGFSATQMFIQGSTGNVGIATMTPTNALHVSATSNPLRLEGLQAGTATDSVMTFNSGGVAKYLPMNGLSSALADSAEWVKLNDSTIVARRALAGADTVAITNDGHFLIGTTTIPGDAIIKAKRNISGVERFDVENTSNANLARAGLIARSDNSVVVMDAFSSTNIQGFGGNFGANGITAASLAMLSAYNAPHFVVQNAGNAPLVFATNSNEQMRITGNGNVGIGTSTPTTATLDAKLKLIKDVTTDGTGSFFNFGSDVRNMLNVSGNTNDIYWGGYASAEVVAGNSSNYTGAIRAIDGAANHLGTGSVSFLYGGYFASNNVSSGTITNSQGLVSQVNNFGSGTITSGIGLQLTALNTAGGSVGSYSGIYTDDLILSTTIPSANRYFINNASTAKSYFNGNVGIGVSNPTRELEVDGNIGMFHSAKNGNHPSIYIDSVNIFHNSPTWVSRNYAVQHVFAGFTNADPKVNSSSNILFDASARSNYGLHNLVTFNNPASYKVDSRYWMQVEAMGNGVNDSFALAVTKTNGATADNNDQLYFGVAHSGNVGIATMTPTNALHVSATANPLRLEGLQAGTSDSVMVVNGTGVVNYKSAASIVSSGSTKGRVACVGTIVQSITNTAVTANATILVTYEDAGAIISTSVSARNAGTDFTVKFASVPPVTAFINYMIIP